MRHYLGLRLGALGLCFVLSFGAGCSRSFYRRQADAEAYDLLYHKAVQVSPQLPNYEIQPPPSSRFFDPFCPDTEPMPPDDALAHRYMHCVDGKAGWHRWHDNGDTPWVENPDWLDFLPADENGCVPLTANDAVRMALLNSDEYQTQLETLYLSALDVSLERFAFDTQLFAGFQSQFTTSGPDHPDGASNNLLVGTLPAGSGGIRKEKLFAGGGSLIVGLANSIVWEFSGNNTQVASTIVDFMLTQPLLQGAGREIVLEALTVAERALLANVRQMQRYQRGFYVEITTGFDAGQGPTRINGINGGLTLGAIGSGGSVPGGGTGGYLGLLQTVQTIRNQEFNVRELQKSVVLFEELAAAGRINRIQVEQLRQALFNAQSDLIGSRADYKNTLDSYKLTLGLPPQLCVEIEDGMLDQFQLFDAEIAASQTEIDDAKIALGKRIGLLSTKVTASDAERGEEQSIIREKLAAGDTNANVCDLILGWLKTGLPHQREPIVRRVVLPWDDEVAKTLKEVESELRPLSEIPKAFLDTHLSTTAADVDKLVSVHEQRKTEFAATLEAIQDQVPLKREIIDQYLSEFELLPLELPKRLTKARKGLENFAGDFERILIEISAIRKTGESRGGLTEIELQLLICLADIARSLGAEVLDVMLVQAEARAESITLNEVELDSDAAIEIARRHRRDWQNARSALVDTWRRIEFVADDLESRLDVVFEGDLRNVGNNPLNLQGDAGRLRARLEFDAPLTRLAERNAYREALINYQQARRDFYGFRDEVALGLRGTLRLIDRNKLLFELQRRAVMVAIRQVDLANERLDEPRRPGTDGSQGGVSDTAARDLTEALRSLLNAQNAFLGVWVNYEVLRRVLDRDLGTMQLDSDGIWLDPGPISPDNGYFVHPSDCPPEVQLESDLLGPLVAPERNPVRASGVEYQETAELHKRWPSLRVPDESLQLRR